MKKIEIIKTLYISRFKEIGIVIKYPFWMKWFMKLVDFYVIPNLKDVRPFCNLSSACDVTDETIFSKLKNPSSIFRIGEVA